MTSHCYRIRRFLVEQLERRELLATLTVNSLLDSSPAGDGFVTLREAIAAANADSTTDLGQTGSGADTIEFDPALTAGGPAVIPLQGQLFISTPLTINGLGADLLTVAQQLPGAENRIFNIASASGDMAINGLTLMGGTTTISQGYGGMVADGGAIRSSTSGHLTINDAIITGNRTTGEYARGGAISASGNLTITNSVISGNSTSGIGANGGGISIRNGHLSIIDSVVSGNVTTGDHAGGGGIHARGPGAQYGATLLSITDSDISDNSTAGYGGAGGGILSAIGNVNLTRATITGNRTNSAASPGGGMVVVRFEQAVVAASTISGNRTNLDISSGGGIFADPPIGVNASLRLENSTVSDNEVAGLDSRGGGISARIGARVVVSNSTISGNRAAGFDPQYPFGYPGGGIYANDVTLTNSTVTNNSATSYGGGIVTYVLTSTNSIVAGNQANSGNVDARIKSFQPSVNVHVDYTLLGNTGGLSAAVLAAINAGTGNLLDQNAGLDTLGDNGGLTETHALLSGSPAISAGDPTAQAGMNGIPVFDQRLAPFGRVSQGRLDMGAFEVQAAIVDGDFNDDGLWNCLDINALTAEIANGTNNPAFDLTGDQMVDLLDRDAWLAEAGNINLGPGLAYRLGDGNLSGFVDGSDFSIWNANKFTQIAAWCSGDFNADGFVDGSDFNIWNSHKFTTSDNMAGPLGQAVLPISLRVASDPQSLRKPADNGLLHAGRTDQPSWRTEVSRPKLPWHGPALQRHRTIRHNLVPMDLFWVLRTPFGSMRPDSLVAHRIDLVVETDTFNV